jgi:hypothetical protein
MTIHSDFFKIVKEGCGNAFTDTPPVRPDVVFIDGQVKLMKADAVDTWPLFFSIQFFKTIEKCFGMGALTVVLGFDDYEHVPVSKAMTQAKRAKQKVNYEFAQSSCLPAKLPDDWGSAMANRTFKVKVVCKVLEVTRTWFENKLKQDPRYADFTLILDYRGVPSVLRAPGAHPIRSFVEDRDWSTPELTIGRGECDIKAFTWMPIAKCLCVVSVDGDYLPLALLQTMRDSACEVLLYRMVTRAAQTTSGKRKSPMEEAEASSQPPRRQYEFVHIAPISAWLRVVFPSKSIDPIRQFCALVALCGCDFARNLPRLGPRSLWKIRQRLQNTDLAQPVQSLCALSLAYHDMFVNRNTLPESVANNVQWFHQTSEDHAIAVYDDLVRRIAQNQRVSERIKHQLWPSSTSRAHAYNTAWTMLYWSMLEQAPDPHAADFGYVRDSKGRTCFAGAQGGI